MDEKTVRILFGNLTNRIATLDDKTFHLPGVITADEYLALKLVSSRLMEQVVSAETKVVMPVTAVEAASEDRLIPESTPPGAEDGATKENTRETHDEEIVLDFSSVDDPPGHGNVRICLDFGTAMSKAALVDDESGDDEVIKVLKLGIPGDQQEISDTMLISSVFIDGEGVIWFGKAAEDRSRLENIDGKRQRLDNIKRRLSEAGLDDPLGKRLNPTDSSVKYRDMILAYLTFFTWTVNVCLGELGYPKNVQRRFAMPCLEGEKRREVAHELGQLVGQAQVLADTFGARLAMGVSLSEFMRATVELRRRPLQYPFVMEELTEPLGVAGSLLNWKTFDNRLAMVIDVGAGTSDFSLYRLSIDPKSGKNTAVEVDGSSKGITEAGNYLDRILIALILKRAGITVDHPRSLEISGKLELDIRNLKESLFNDESVFVPINGAEDVEISLAEFLQTDAVVKFGDSLKAAMQSILEEVNDSFIHWVSRTPGRYLTVVLTGGGSSLPMVKVLAEGTLKVGNDHIPLAVALPFPKWLEELHPDLESDYSRVAVSLGGARRRIIHLQGVAMVTAGDVIDTPKLGGYYVTGQQS
jgi:hypothetical protein